MIIDCDKCGERHHALRECEPKAPQPAPEPERPADRETVLRRVVKLLALSKSSNANEAASAAAKAQELLLKYKLSLADASAAGGNGEAPKPDPFTRVKVDIGARAAPWKVHLSTAIAHGLNCKNLFRSGDRYFGGARVTFIGRESDVQVCQYLFDYLVREIDRLCDAEVERLGPGYFGGGAYSSKAWRNDFRDGAVSTLRKRLREGQDDFVAGRGEAAPVTKQEGDRRRALVLAAARDVDEYIAQDAKLAKVFAKKGRSLGRGFVASHGAYEAGKRAGESIQIRKGVSGDGSGPKQIGGGR